MRDFEELVYLLKRNIKLEEENFALSAGACCVRNEKGTIGAVGDEHGNAYCTLQRDAELLLDTLETIAATTTSTNAAALRMYAQCCLDEYHKK